MQSAILLCTWYSPFHEFQSFGLVEDVLSGQQELWNHNEQPVAPKTSAVASVQ